MECLFTAQLLKEGGTMWVWEEGKERLNGGCVQSMKKTMSGKAVLHGGIYLSNRPASQSSSCILYLPVIRCLEVKGKKMH